MRKLLRCLSLALVASLWMLPSKAQQSEGEDSLLMTIACLSDLHTEYDMIDCESTSKVRLRGTINTTLTKMGQEETIDLMLLGGDYTSQVTAPTERHWKKARTLLEKATRGAFPEGAPTPVIYASGNHEYDAAGYGNDKVKGWNSADYYTEPMSEDVGELAPDECFYETVKNGSKDMKLLAAYHYEVGGFDFVVLNTAKYLFKSNENYYYSKESVEWVSKKIASLYADDPDKTLFFLVHIPFGDSNSISAANKGQNETKSESGAKELKAALSQYPNLIMLYGHDHGGDKAYIREKTSQRVTRYDVNGKVISSFDENHVNGTVQGYVEPEPEPVVESAFYLKTIVDGVAKYLAVVPTSNSNIGLADEADKQPVSVVTNGSLLTTTISYNNSSYYLSAGTGFNFKSGSAGSGEQNSGYWFEIADPAAETLAATKVAEPEAGKYYVIIQNYNGYMALSNSLKNTDNAGKFRLEGIAVSGMSSSVESLSLPAADFGKCVYQYVEGKTSSEPQEGSSYKYYMKGFANGKYLGWDSSTSRIAMLDAANRQEAKIVKEDGEDRFSTSVISGGTTYNMSVGADFGYNFKTDAVYGGEQGHGYWFEIEDPTAANLVAKKVSELKNNAYYLVIHQYSSEGYSALGTEVVDMTGAGKYRVKGTKIDDFSASATTLTLNGADYKNCIYQYEAVSEEVDPVDPVEPSDADPSFVSLFLGSMRYYNNTIEGDWIQQNYTKNAKVIQAMMIYVYSNRIEFHMKNYGESGAIKGAKGTVTVNKDLEPYTIFRTIKRKDITPVEIVTVDNHIDTDVMYNIYGLPVTEDYQGIIIKNGVKYLR